MDVSSFASPNGGLQGSLAPRPPRPQLHQEDKGGSQTACWRQTGGSGMETSGAGTSPAHPSQSVGALDARRLLHHGARWGSPGPAHSSSSAFENGVINSNVTNRIRSLFKQHIFSMEISENVLWAHYKGILREVFHMDTYLPYTAMV